MWIMLSSRFEPDIEDPSAVTVLARDSRGEWSGALLPICAEENRAVKSITGRAAPNSTDVIETTVNRFYQDRGWQLAETYITHGGRSMNRYTKRLDP